MLEVELHGYNGTSEVVERFKILTPAMSADEKQAIMDLTGSQRELERDARRLQDALEEASRDDDAEEVDRLESEIDRLQQRVKAASIFEVARRLWVGWPEGELLDSDGQSLPFSEEQRDDLLGVDGMPTAIYTAWMRQIYGGGARRKKSKPPRGLG